MTDLPGLDAGCKKTRGEENEKDRQKENGEKRETGGQGGELVENPRSPISLCLAERLSASWLCGTGHGP